MIERRATDWTMSNESWPTRHAKPTTLLGRAPLDLTSLYSAEWNGLLFHTLGDGFWCFASAHSS